MTIILILSVLVFFIAVLCMLKIKTSERFLESRLKSLKVAINNSTFHRFCANNMCGECSLNRLVNGTDDSSCDLLAIQNEISDIIDKEIGIWK